MMANMFQLYKQESGTTPMRVMMKPAADTKAAPAAATP